MLGPVRQRPRITVPRDDDDISRKLGAEHLRKTVPVAHPTRTVRPSKGDDISGEEHVGVREVHQQIRRAVDARTGNQPDVLAAEPQPVRAQLRPPAHSRPAAQAGAFDDAGRREVGQPRPLMITVWEDATTFASEWPTWSWVLITTRG